MIGIYEPIYFTDIANLKVVKTKHMLVPIQDGDLGQSTKPYQEDWSTSATRQEDIFVKYSDLSLNQVDLIETCQTNFCDGQHDIASVCPALKSGKPKSIYVISCFVTSDVANVKSVPFQSAAFTTLFLGEETMKVRIM